LAQPPLPITLFDYVLPPERIAQEPASPRDQSRLMLLPTTGPAQHRRFLELPDLLDRRDLLVVNRTQVVPARLSLRKETGGRVEVLLTRPVAGGVRIAKVWQGIGRPLKSLRDGQLLSAVDGSTLKVVSRAGETIVVESELPLWDLMTRCGEVPLPPYIDRPDGPRDVDVTAYQTIFARDPGAVAAPTAGLHFTPQILEALAAAGVERADVVLHVGPGTFLPIRQEHEADVTQHRMHREWYAIDDASVAAIRATKARGGRVVAVGTTTVRALETWAQTGEASGESELFIVPGFEFALVDLMLTNFHLPRSTLLMLVSAFAGRERVLRAYAEAVAQQYRFFSYGDAMLVYPATHE
jgi:S-adenosylmethionine:tRNA ribosyltransferase-isomerase